MTGFSFCDAYEVWISLLFLEFANSNPVEGFNDGTLQMTFTELRQVGILDVWGGVGWGGGIHCVLCFSVGRFSNDCGVVCCVVWYGMVFIVCYVSQLVDLLMTLVWCDVWCGEVWCGMVYGMVFIVCYVSQLVDLLMTVVWCGMV